MYATGEVQVDKVYVLHYFYYHKKTVHFNCGEFKYEIAVDT